MKALWGSGPHRGQPVHLRSSHIVVDEQGVEARPPFDAPVPERRIWTVREIVVGDRRWRVILPDDWTLDQALLALIDADPAMAREAEVNPQ